MKISNKKVEVPKTDGLNDQTILSSILNVEKNMSTDLNIALNECSCEQHYKKILKIFNDVRNSQRSIYELSFSLGWYQLEEAETKKINETLTKLKKDM
ncbi:MAG: spore coat protein [Mycoplasmatota bacterium]